MKKIVVGSNGRNIPRIPIPVSKSPEIKKIHLNKGLELILTSLVFSVSDNTDILKLTLSNLIQSKSKLNTIYFLAELSKILFTTCCNFQPYQISES